MFLPIVSYADGYGFTYGGRVSTVDLLGIGERLSVPLTWGGTRRAALEFERTFKTGPADPRRLELGDLEPREPALRDRRSARRGQRRGPNACSRDVVRAGVDDAAAAPSASASSTTGCGPSAPTPRSTRASIRRFPATPSCSAPAGPACTSAAAGPHQPLHDRRARLPRRLQPGRVAGRAAVRRRRRDAARRTSGCCSAAPSTCAASAPAPSTAIACSSTSAELRVPITSVLNGAKLGRHGVHRRRQGVELRAVDEGRRMAPRRRRRGVPDRLVVRINLDVAHGLKTATRGCISRRGSLSERQRRQPVS